MQDSTKYIGLDVHRDTISVAVGDPGAAPPRLWGSIENEPLAVDKLIKQLSPQGEKLQVFYEAGPCGYGLYRPIRAKG